MLEAIQEYMNYNNYCPLENADLYNLGGFTEAALREWKRRCHLDLDGMDDATNDLAFGGSGRGRRRYCRQIR